MMRSLSLLSLALALTACSKPGPPPDPPGVVADTPNDPFLRIRQNIVDKDCTADLVLHPGGAWQISGVRRRDVSVEECVADPIACAETYRNEGQLDPAAWASAMTALDAEKFWTLGSLSQGLHVIAPGTPDRDKAIASLPAESRPMPQQAGAFEIEWRRPDGKRKYLFDMWGSAHARLYADLDAAVHMSEIACSGAKPQ